MLPERKKQDDIDKRENDREEREEGKGEKEGKKKICKVRPKKGDKIKFNLIEEEGNFEGRVTKVGKASGKDKHRCWVTFEDEQTRSFDFSHKVGEWNIVNMVQFTEEVKESTTRKEVRQKEIEMDRDGAKVLYYTMRGDIL